MRTKDFIFQTLVLPELSKYKINERLLFDIYYI